MTALVQGIAALSRALRPSRATARCRTAAIRRAMAVSSSRARMPALDEARALRDESRRVIAGLEARYRERQRRRGSCASPQWRAWLFHRSSRPQHADKLAASPARDLFRHRQTIGSAVRFSTEELASLASRIAEAAEQALAIERELFDALAADVSNASAALLSHRRRAGRARCCRRARRTRRRAIVMRVRSIDESLAFAIARGRHPVVEAALAQLNAGLSFPTTATCLPKAAGASGSSPVRTWRANRRSCARTR